MPCNSTLAPRRCFHWFNVASQAIGMADWSSVTSVFPSDIAVYGAIVVKVKSAQRRAEPAPYSRKKRIFEAKNVCCHPASFTGNQIEPKPP